MVHIRNTVLASVLVVGLGFMSACSSDDNAGSPSNPSSPNPPNPSAPRIASLSPNTPRASATAQTMTVTGERFGNGLTVLLDAPNGAWTTHGGGAIAVQSPTTFTLTVMLDKVGVWDITVHSAEGLESNEVQFFVAQ